MRIARTMPAAWWERTCPSFTPTSRTTRTSASSPRMPQTLRAKAKDRWYVPDPHKAGDLVKLRERTLLREFKECQDAEHGRLKLFRLEAIRAGFRRASKQAITLQFSTLPPRSPTTCFGAQTRASDVLRGALVYGNLVVVLRWRCRRMTDRQLKRLQGRFPRPRVQKPYMVASTALELQAVSRELHRNA